MVVKRLAVALRDTAGIRHELRDCEGLVACDFDESALALSELATRLDTNFPRVWRKGWLLTPRGQKVLFDLTWLAESINRLAESGATAEQIRTMPAQANEDFHSFGSSARQRARDYWMTEYKTQLVTAIEQSIKQSRGIK